MRKNSCRQIGALLLALILAVSCLSITLMSGQRVRDDLYAAKADAAQRMQTCMDRICGYKGTLGLAISADDLHSTGMIGDPYSPITTTLGALEAKRTTANSDMAAMVVELLDQCGIGAEQTVGAGFSGSFPALDIAVLCACAAMDIECVYIASVGASTYGANQPELTLPDMLCRLAAEGLVPAPAAVTMGGADDLGLDMDSEALQEITARISTFGVPIVQCATFSENIDWRMSLYHALGPIDCFVGVGGNITTSGEGSVRLEQGILQPDSVQQINASSGLLDRYCAEGLPVIHLLNIKELVTDYGLPYDPDVLPEIGTSAIYYETQYSALPALLALPCAAALLCLGFGKQSRTKPRDPKG